jgi:hypothetical protein
MAQSRAAAQLMRRLHYALRNAPTDSMPIGLTRDFKLIRNAITNVILPGPRVYADDSLCNPTAPMVVRASAWGISG